MLDRVFGIFLVLILWLYFSDFCYSLSKIGKVIVMIESVRILEVWFCIYGFRNFFWVWGVVWFGWGRGGRGVRGENFVCYIGFMV